MEDDGYDDDVSPLAPSEMTLVENLKFTEDYAHNYGLEVDTSFKSGVHHSVNPVQMQVCSRLHLLSCPEKTQTIRYGSSRRYEIHAFIKNKYYIYPIGTQV